MSYDPIDYEAIQRRVIERVQRRYRFGFHTAIFVLGIPLIGGWGSPEFFILWVGLWLFHLFWMQYQNTVVKAVQDEIEAERSRVIKRKRDMADIHARYQNGDFSEHYDGRPDWLGEDGEIHIFHEEDEYRH